MAYKYVNESEYHRYRSDCSAVLQDTCARLKHKGISARFVLIGSGGRNLVTRNGDGPFDLDYNLEIIKAPDEYWKDLRKLKDTVRVTLNKSEGFDCFSDTKDSTSCLTAILHFKDSPHIEFSFDVAIVRKTDNGNYLRLIHNKNAFYIGGDQYTWVEAPGSHDLKLKADKIKKVGLWPEVRDRYLELKNKYLRQRDNNHPSFIIYVETVNEIYGKYYR